MCQEAGLATKFRSHSPTQPTYNEQRRSREPLSTSSTHSTPNGKTTQTSPALPRRATLYDSLRHTRALYYLGRISHVSVVYPQTPLRRGGRYGGMCDPAAEHQDGRKVCQTPLFHVGHTSSTGRELWSWTYGGFGAREGLTRPGLEVGNWPLGRGRCKHEGPRAEFVLCCAVLCWSVRMVLASQNHTAVTPGRGGRAQSKEFCPLWQVV